MPGFFNIKTDTLVAMLSVRVCGPGTQPGHKPVCLIGITDFSTPVPWLIDKSCQVQEVNTTICGDLVGDIASDKGDIQFASLVSPTRPESTQPS